MVGQITILKLMMKDWVVGRFLTILLGIKKRKAFTVPFKYEIK